LATEVIEKLGESVVVAKIDKVLIDKGNRIYKLQFVKNKLEGKFGTIILDLNGYKEEATLFYRVGDENLVEVDVHACPDLLTAENQVQDMFYVWQRRRPTNRRAASCPRCHYWLDKPNLQGR